jgi:glycosyltransferase involved in cell wall biosynthesis
MLFSIIIPTYNRSAILRETLLSVLSQTYLQYEIIVVDDGSTDNTKEVVERMQSEKIHYYYKKNEERSVARNYGADKATGDYLVFLDSDDKMKEDHLMSIFNYIDQFAVLPEFIFAGYQILNTDGTPLYGYGVSGFFDQKKLVYGNFLGCSSVIVQKEIFKKHYFNTDPDLILFEDWELWLRIIANNKLYCFPGKSIIMINHGGRSVLNYDPAQFSDKVMHFKSLVLQTNSLIKDSFLNRRIFCAGIYSYAALHIAMTKKSRALAFKYLLVSLLENPFFILKRRFFAIIKHLF